MPWSCGDEEQQESGEEMELAPAPPFAGDGQIGDEGDANDDQGEQTLGEGGERHQDVNGIPAPARVGR